MSTVIAEEPAALILNVDDVSTFEKFVLKKVKLSL
jgi:hypothetical protein